MISTFDTFAVEQTVRHTNSVAEQWRENLRLPRGPIMIPDREDRTQYADMLGSSAFFETERELRFFMKTDALRKINSLPDLTVKTIAQHSFPEESFDLLSTRLPIQDSRHLFGEIDVRRARLRHIHFRNQDLFFIQTKSGKREIEGLRVERDEPTVQITAEHYRDLLPLATGGSLMKMRVVARGEVRYSGPADSNIELHADILLAAGKRDDRGLPPVIRPEQLPGAVVELEFRDARVLPAILSGQHSFAKLLRGSPLLNRQPQEIQKALKTSRIARKGFDKRASQAMKLLASNSDL